METPAAREMTHGVEGMIISSIPTGIRARAGTGDWEAKMVNFELFIEWKKVLEHAPIEALTEELKNRQ